MARTLPLERSLRFPKGLNSTRGCDRAGHGERASGVQVALAGTGPGTASLRGVVFSQEDAAMRGACRQQVSRCQVCANPRLGTAAGKGSWDMQRCSEPHLDALGALGGLSHSRCCFFSSFTFLAF